MPAGEQDAARASPSCEACPGRSYDGVIAIHSSTHHLLGTVVEIQATAGRRTARRAAETAVTEIKRLMAIFDMFDPTSELSRWRIGQVSTRTPELVAVSDLADTWQTLSGGAFNSSVEGLRTLWAGAAELGQMPSGESISTAVEALSDPVESRMNRNLNAIAKGWIVDAAIAAAVERHDPRDFWISAGGDLRHVGERPMLVGIEDPGRPFDNVAPLLRIPLRSQALATSGTVRRGREIAGTWYSHVIDPRSGTPVQRRVSASVIAKDAASADALATILTVDERVGWDLCNAVGALGLVIGDDGSVAMSDAWPSL
jgi:thiamine biosynthesis lipoprotein